MMKNNVRIASLAAFLLIALSLSADQVHNLSWKDLVPTGLLNKDPTMKLSLREQSSAEWMMYLRKNLSEMDLEDEDKDTNALNCTFLAFLFPNRTKQVRNIMI